MTFSTLKRKTPMKRTGFKRKAGKPLSRTRRSPIGRLKTRANEVFSPYIRQRDALETTGTLTRCKCITCGKEGDTFKGDIQCGHFIAGRLNNILFDEQNAHGQCTGCNKFRSGNWPAYLEAMQKKYGQPTIERLLAARHTMHRFRAWELRDIIDLFIAKIRILGGEVPQ